MIRQFCLILLLSFISFQYSHANEIQVWICEAGNNFGQAIARIEIAVKFKSLDMGDQEVAMFANLDNAVRFINEIESSLPPPWSSIRKDNQHASRIKNMVNRLKGKWDAIPLHQRVGEVEDIYGSYLESLRYTYNISRPDEVQRNSNCDSKHFQLCYEYGKATIASETAGDPDRLNFVKRYHRNANSAISNTISTGLALAMDPGHELFDGHSKKVCCGFGLKVLWDQRPAFSENSSVGEYLDYRSDLLNIIALAQPSYECRESIDHCVSSSYTFNSIREWKMLNDQCFQDPRYQWLLRHPDVLKVRKPLMIQNNSIHQVGGLNTLVDLRSDFQVMWHEPPNPNENNTPQLCPCDYQYKKTDRIKGVAGIDQAENVDIRTQPSGTSYLYYSKDKAAFFKLFIEEKMNPDKIYSYQYYRDLATCLIKEVEPYALPCNCENNEEVIPNYSSQNDPVIIANNGNDAPSIISDEEIHDAPSSPINELSKKEKWTANLVLNDLKFYNRGWDDVPIGERQYQYKFDRSTSQFIGYELNIGSIPPNEDVEFVLEEIWYNEDGSIRYQEEKNTHFPKDWNKAYYINSYGSKTPYNWPVGNYIIELKIDGHVIGSRSFEVTPPPSVASYEEWIQSILPREFTIFESDKYRKDRNFNAEEIYHKDSTRYINFSICLESRPPENDIPFIIDYKYYDIQGNVVAKHSTKCVFKQGFEYRCYEQGYGSDIPGSFLKENYYVLELSIGGKVIESKSFNLK